MKRYGLSAALFLFLLTGLAHAQVLEKNVDWPVPRGPSNEPVPYRFDPAVVKKLPHSFIDDASACILYTSTSHLIQADGTVETITHEVTRLGSRKGIDSLGEYQSITFDPNYQKLVLNEARIHKTNGTVVNIEPKHVNLRDVTTDYLVYNPDKQLVISFPSLEVGDIYEVKWTTRGKSPEFGEHFFTRYSFGDDRNPIACDELHVVVPKDKPFKYASINGKVDLKTKEIGQQKHYHWSVKNRPGLPRDEERPSLEELRLQVAFATYPDWEAVARWKQKVRAECWTCTTNLKKVINEVAGPHKTQTEKARALTYWVRRQVRYMSRGPGGLGYTPHLPEQVVANRFGDCKDQAQLLAVMLKEIGLPVYLVTLGPLDDGQVLPEVPSPWGTHAILLVKIDGKDHWIDTTVSRAGWDYIPRGDRNRQTYVTRDAELQLLKTPEFTWKDNRFDQTSDVFVASDGTATVRRQSTYHGAAALSRRDAWLETPSGERRRLIVQELQDAASRSRLTTFQINDKELLDFDSPVTAKVEYQLPRHFIGDDVLEGSLTDSVLWGRLLAYNVDSERKLPLQLPGPFASTHRFRVHLPPVFRFDGLPRKQQIHSRWGQVSVEVSLIKGNPRELEVVLDTRLEKDRIDPKHFAEYQTFHDDVSRAYRVWLNLKATRDPADAPLLETMLALAPGFDLMTVQTLARIYLAGSRFDDARRVLDTALFYHLNEASLWDLRVQASGSLSEEERIYRAAVRQFPNMRRFQLALGGVLVKRHNHVEARKTLEPLTGKQADSDAMRGQAHYQLARDYWIVKEYASSLKHLGLADEMDPAVMDPIEAQHFLAKVHEKAGNVALALAAYRRALASEPTSRSILGDLIRVQFTQDDKKETLDLVRRFTLLAGQDESALAEAAGYHYRLGRVEDALELAERSRDIGYTSQAQRLLGLIHLHKGDFTKAIFHLERTDANPEVEVSLLRAYQATGQLRLAEQRLDRPLDKTSPALELLRLQIKELSRHRQELLQKVLDPAERKIVAGPVLDAFICADNAHRQGELAERVKAILAPALADGVIFGPAYALQALLELDQGKISKATADVEKALAKGPADSRVYLVRGRVRLLRGETGALPDLELASQLSFRKDAMILHWLAAAQFQAGQRDRALATQKLAVDLRPRDEDVLAQLREFEKAK